MYLFLVKIDLEEVKKEWLHTTGPYQVMKIASHFGVYEHLFGWCAFFTPRVHLDVKFEIEGSDLMHPVHYGNVIKPTTTLKAPIVNFDGSFSLRNEKTNEKALWSLVLTNPDGHLSQQGKEYVHWFM